MRHLTFVLAHTLYWRGAAGLLILVLLGCATVPPYQRGRLAQPSMQQKPALDAAFDAHVSDLRESAIGASSGENASCGCR